MTTRKKRSSAASVSLTVWRTITQSETITGDGLTVSVQDGCLLISNDNVVIYVLSPGQWVTVNQTPV